MNPINFGKVKNVCGIYAIINKSVITPHCKEGKPYIGQSVSMGDRLFSKHRPRLRSGTHVNKHLQNSWNKYGECNFDFCLIEEIERNNLTNREDFWIKHYLSNDSKYGYNKRLASDSNAGMIINPLPEENIKEWVNEYFENYGFYPNQKSGKVHGTTWEAIDMALVGGLRGLEGGRSLSKLIKSNFVFLSATNYPDYTEEIIWKWVKQHCNKFGKYPNAGSGRVQFAEEDGYFSMLWASIDKAFVFGRKGLVGGTSLSKFIKRRKDEVTI